MNNAILFNWSIALGAWALGGPLWAALTFLAVALVRISLESQNLRDETAELRRRLILLGGPFGFNGDDGEESLADAPASETRTVSGTMPRARAAS